MINFVRKFCKTTVVDLSFFIAKRIHSAPKGKRVARPGIRIAVVGIAFGLAVMILSVAVTIGFKQEIRDKVIGFGSHIQLLNIYSGHSFESLPIIASDSLLHLLAADPDVQKIEQFALKQGVIKTNTDFLGIVIKGVGLDYDLSFFQKNLVQGEMISITDSVSNQILVSQDIADKLLLKPGDSFLVYFIQENVKVRKFVISGIYRTYFSEYDEIFAIADLRVIQRLNNWSVEQVGGIEIILKDFDRVDIAADNLFFEINRNYPGAYYLQKVTDFNPQTFSWLDVLDTNVWVILTLMWIVSSFTIVSGLMILIFERVSMIGILKALGADNFVIRKTFLFLASFLVLRGMFWGNVIALTICFIQSHFQLLKLDSSKYYIETAPVSLNVGHLLLLNIATLLISITILVFPSYLIAKINPAKSIRFV
jgi:lipoprotein-releasing system permease protein